MKKSFLLVVVIALVVVAGIFLYPRFTKKPVDPNELVLSGNIEAHDSLVSFKVSGRIVDLPIQEGQSVAANALIAKLDDADYRQKVNIDEANVMVRQSNLELATAGGREQDVKAAEQSVADAEANLQQRKIDFERAQRLFGHDAISAQDRDNADTALKRADAQYQSAKQKLSETREGSRKEEVAIAQANVKAARENLGLSRINLQYTTLRAPYAGVISVRQAELGEVVSAGTPVVTLTDLDHVWLRAYVPETDLGRIHFGQEAAIQTDTYPGKTYRGRISFIADKAEFTPKSVQTFKERVTLVYRIKIDVENSNHELKPGMPADARIALGAASQQTAQQ
jgi:HlyD family secretion protein